MGQDLEHPRRKPQHRCAPATPPKGSIRRERERIETIGYEPFAFDASATPPDNSIHAEVPIQTTSDFQYVTPEQAQTIFKLPFTEPASEIESSSITDAGHRNQRQICTADLYGGACG
jgi:hypothetical protein